MNKLGIEIKSIFLLFALCGAVLIFGIISDKSTSAELKEDQTSLKPLPNLNGEKAKEHLKEQGLYESLGEAMQSAKYSIYPTENHPLKNKEKEVFSAGNPRQAYSTYFSTDGITLVSAQENNKWEIGMNLEQIGHGDDLQKIKSGEMKVQKNKSNIEIEKLAVSGEQLAVNKQQSAITEWYKNTSNGLEQGWTINERVSEKAEGLKLVLSVKSDLQMKLAADEQAVDFVRENDEPIVRYDKLKSWDADGKDLTSKMKLEANRLAIVVDDRTAKYPITVDPFFVATKKLTASDAAFGDNFGWSVSISGDTAIVGARLDNDGAISNGSVYIFERNTGGANNWGEVQKLTASDAAAGDQFGYSVSISGSTVIVGAQNNTDGGIAGGSAYLFERNQGGADNWGEVKKLTASDAAAGDFFGFSVSISGATAIVGAYSNDDVGSASGSAYIFERNTGGADNWGEVKKLTASDAASFQQFGWSVSISEDTAIIGARFDDDAGVFSGSAYIFERNMGGADNWGEVQKLTASDAAAAAEFGYSVSISGNTAIVGALNDIEAGNTPGSAYIFERNAGGANLWGEVRKLNASDAATGDDFGVSVAISGDTAIVGALGNDDGGSDSGSAYIFERNTGGANIWGEVQKLAASDAAAGDEFGVSVAISDGTAIVGASGNDDAGSDSGSAYVYTNQNNNWQETTRRTSADGNANDLFGISVSISGDMAIIGASSNGIGGAAYIFERNTGGANNWSEVKKITASDAAAVDFFGFSVSISGDTAIVGAVQNLPGGAAYIFERNMGGANNWGEVKILTASDATTGDFFGSSVSISGDTVIVGAAFDDDAGVFSGSAYIFERNAGGANNWGEVKKITASDADANDSFGRWVAISGDTAIVGADGNDDVPNDSGSAYIFERNQGGADNWGEVKKLTAPDADANDRFGISVSISGDMAIVGAYLNDDGGMDSGSAYIFGRNTGGTNNWGAVKKLTASDAAAGDNFGDRVSISGSKAVVAASNNDDGGMDSGSAYIFERNTGGANNWGAVKKLTASNAATGDSFGSVSISGDTVIVGASGVDIPSMLTKQSMGKGFSANLAGENQGAMYIFNALASPTSASASISGRVLSPTGRAIPNATVLLTEQNGTNRTARTNMFGYFRFEGVRVGQTLTFNAYSKRFQFDMQVINLSDSVNGLEIKAR